MVAAEERAEPGRLLAGVSVPGQRLSLAPSGADLQALTKAGNAASDVATDLQKTVRAVNAPDGPLQQISLGTQALSNAANALERSTVPRINRTADEVSQAMRQMGSAVGRFGENPQALIYGTGPIAPGPGEPGFASPAVQK